MSSSCSWFLLSTGHLQLDWELTSVFHTILTNFTDNYFAVWLVRPCVCLSVCPSLSLSLSLLVLPFCLSMFLCLRSTALFQTVGPWIRVGRAVLDPRRGPATAGVVLALGLGQGPVAVTAFGAWWRGEAKLGGGRQSRATCMPEAYGLASEWRMATGGTHEGLQWAQQQHGVDIKEENEYVKDIMNGIVACTLKGNNARQVWQRSLLLRMLLWCMLDEVSWRHRALHKQILLLRQLPSLYQLMSDRHSPAVPLPVLHSWEQKKISCERYTLHRMAV